MRLAAGPGQALGEVEHDVGPRLAESDREVGIGLQPDHLPGLSQGPLDRGDGGLVVPLGVGVLELELGAGGAGKG